MSDDEKPTASEGTEDKECSICHEDIVGESVECCSCYNKICKACSEEEYHERFEWLCVDTKCAICKGFVCEDCVVICYDCSNQGDDPPSYCGNCAPENIVELSCKYHSWWTCGKHEKCCDQHNNNGCGECHANYGFDMKHRVF